MIIRQRQGGFVLMAAVVLIVIAAIFAVVIAYMSVSSSQSAGMHAAAAQALFQAESGLERAIFRFNNGTACAALAPDSSSNLGNGSFNVTNTYNTDFDGVSVLAADQCRIRVVGSFSNSSRTIEGIVGDENLLPASANTDFNDPNSVCNINDPCQPTNWNLTATPAGTFQPWQDDAGPDAANPTYFDRAAYAVKTSPGSSTATNAGQLTFAPPISLTAPTTITISFDYRVIRDPSGGSGNEMQVTFTLFEKAPGTGSWTHASPFESGHTGSWQTGASRGSVTISITGSGPVEIDLMEFTLFVKSGRPKQVWVDNISLATSGTPKKELQRWREVFN